MPPDFIEFKFYLEGTKEWRPVIIRTSSIDMVQIDGEGADKTRVWQNGADVGLLTDMPWDHARALLLS